MSAGREVLAEYNGSLLALIEPDADRFAADDAEASLGALNDACAGGAHRDHRPP